MRIRRCASCLLGSVYPAAQPETTPRFELPLPLPPPPFVEPIPVAPEPHAGGGGFAAATACAGLCERSRSPCDLIPELGLSDPQEHEDFVEQYSFPAPFGASSWLFSTSVPADSAEDLEEGVVMDNDDSAQARHELVKTMRAKKTVVKKKEKESIEPEKKAKLKKDEDGDLAAREAQVWTCKKNDGKRWYCQRPVSKPNSLCDYHFEQKRAYYSTLSESESISAAPVVAAPSAASKSSTSSKAKPRRKKKWDGTLEEYYYFTDFGPFRSKKLYRRSMLEFALAEQEKEALPEDHAAPTAGQAEAEADDIDHQVAAREDHPICDDVAVIAGCDEESSDDMYGNGDIKKSQLKKSWKKPKKRSLTSLM